MEILSIYLVLGLPIALAFVLIESGAPWIRRLLLMLSILPFWPVIGGWYVYLALKRAKIALLCGWCGKFMGFTQESARKHVLECDSHPWTELVHSVGFELFEEDDRAGLIGHGCIYWPPRKD